MKINRWPTRWVVGRNRGIFEAEVNSRSGHPPPNHSNLACAAGSTVRARVRLTAGWRRTAGPERRIVVVGTGKGDVVAIFNGRGLSREYSREGAEKHQSEYFMHRRKAEQDSCCNGLQVASGHITS